jgi:hypothetical protein
MNTKPLLLTILCFSLSLIPTANFVGQTAAQHKTESLPAGVRYSVLSQRWLTEGELKQQKDAFATIAIRLRLSNDSGQDVYYLASKVSPIMPVDHLLRRKAGELKWSNPSDPKEDALEFSGDGYVWVWLPSHAAIEIEHDMIGIPTEEQAFSIYVKFNSKAEPIQVISDAFRSLAR